MAMAQAVTALSTQAPIQILQRRRSTDLASLRSVYGELSRSWRSHGAGAAESQQPTLAMLFIQKLLALDCIQISYDL
ncbi:hypothetical protein [Comamonas sp. C24C]